VAVAVVTAEDLLTDRAELVLAAMKNLRFGVAEEEAERDAVLRMRFDCVVAEGWARPEDFPDGRAREDDDADALLVVCYADDQLAASMRIVLPAADRRLPTEREFGVRARPAGQVVDAGRLVVAPRSRARLSHRIIGGLSARGWLEIWRRGYTRAISSATPQLIELYAAFGLQVTVLGPARQHYGAQRAPIAIDGSRATFEFLAD
jgi:hypothetical protein